MELNSIKPADGSKRERRRVGRGIGSGLGKTAGRGHKGQKVACVIHGEIFGSNLSHWCCDRHSE